MMRQVLLATAGAAGVLSAGAAQASDWIVTLGGRAQAVVPYEGASHDIFVPTPAIQLRRADRPDRPSFADDGLGLALLNTGGLSVGPELRLRSKRNSDGELVGVSSVPLAIEPGAFVTLWATRWLRLHGEGRRGIRGDHGWTADGALDLVGKTGRWTATVGPRVGWGDQNYMETYFGVTPLDAIASPVIKTPYTPTSGLRYVGGYASLGYHFGRHWQTTANVGFHRLAAQAADSPIVRILGSRDELSGGLGLKYSFGWRR